MSPPAAPIRRARRAFWRRITALAEQGVTIIVTTHFMQEAEYCDRIAIMDSGRIWRRARRPRCAVSPGPRSAPSPAWKMPSSPSSSGHARAHDGVLVGVAYQRLAIEAAAHPRIGVKESRQIVRDPSSIAIGVVLPLILILLFGYGLSLDVKNVPIAIVMEYPTPEAVELAAGFKLSPYFHPVPTRSMPPAQQLLLEHRVDGIVRIPADFSRRFAAGDAQVQLIVHGGDANRARIIEGYVQGVVGAWAATAGGAGAGEPGASRSTCNRACGSTRRTIAAISWCLA